EMSTRPARVAAVVLGLSRAALAAPPPHGPEIASTGILGSHLIILVGAWATCDRHEPDTALAPNVRREMRDLAEALHRKDPRAGLRLLENPDRGTFERTIRAQAAPLFVVYSGHGTLAGGRSQLCLSD